MSRIIFFLILDSTKEMSSSVFLLFFLILFHFNDYICFFQNSKIQFHGEHRRNATMPSVFFSIFFCHPAISTRQYNVLQCCSISSIQEMLGVDDNASSHRQYPIIVMILVKRDNERSCCSVK